MEGCKLCFLKGWNDFNDGLRGGSFVVEFDLGDSKKDVISKGLIGGFVNMY